MVERAEAAFSAARYGEAAQLFLDAHRIAEQHGLGAKPELLFNAGLAFERIDACDRVADLFTRYLEAKPSARTADLEFRLSRAKECAPEVSVASDPLGAEVSVDGTVRGRTPILLRLKTGTHTVKIELTGFKAQQRTINVEARKPTTINERLEADLDAPKPAPMAAKPPPLVAPAPLREAPRQATDKPLFWVSASAAGAGLVVGTLLTILSRAAVDRRDAEISKPVGASDMIVHSEQDTAVSTAIGAHIGFGVAAAGAIGAMLIVLFPDDDPPLVTPEEAYGRTSMGVAW